MPGMKFTFLRGAVILPVLAATACEVSLDSQSQIAREEKRFVVSGTASLRVTTFDGSIQIRSWDKPDILVEVEKRGPTRESIDALEIRTEQNGNAIELEVKKPRSESFTGFGIHRSATARLIVSVPHHIDVRARSGDGSIRIERVNGRIELHTGDGSIHASDVTGEMTFNTGDGSVTVAGAEGRLDLDTGDGGVNVTGKLTSLRLHTGDGSIVYRAEPGTAMADDWEITTGDGGVSLYLPESFDAEMDAHTGGGTIRNELSVTATGGGEVNRRIVRGRLGEGGKRLRIRTGDGSIRLRVS
jgi:DUF4097 and DUF4098 domain-containing protein YvlB